MKTDDKNNHKAFIEQNYFIPEIMLRGIYWVCVKLAELVIEGDFINGNPHNTSI